jgi:Na+-translocating ferredoxin:NAD+ oxidoreductase RnfA subunit
MSRARGWAFFTACARLACVPWIVGGLVLFATRGTRDWIPSAAVMLGCWFGLALALVGLFGLIRIRHREAEESLPWSRATFVLAIAGLIGSLMMAGLSVVVLSAIDDRH